jgi:hypothetical protein
MKLVNFVFVALLALFSVGSVFVMGEMHDEPILLEGSAFLEYTGIVPMGVCNYYCYRCVKLNGNGVCTISGSCC